MVTPELGEATIRAVGGGVCDVRSLKPGDGADARRFCLATIREVFGHDYRPDWHADLDALERDDHQYLPERGGTFLVVRHGGRIVGTAGLRALGTAPHLEARFAGRYPRPSEVGSVWRTYLDPSLRSRGIGAEMVAELERRAAALGYRSIYLHTAGHSPRSVSFWEGQGFRPFAADDDADATIHLDKTIGPVLDLTDEGVSSR